MDSVQVYVSGIFMWMCTCLIDFRQEKIGLEVIINGIRLTVIVTACPQKHWQMPMTFP